jgi:hypothetical protein
VATAVKPSNILVRPETARRATGRKSPVRGSDPSPRRRSIHQRPSEGSDPLCISARRRDLPAAAERGRRS